MMPIAPQSYFKESFVRFPTCCEHCNMGKVVNDDLKMTMGGAMVRFSELQKLLKMKPERSMSFVLYVSCLIYTAFTKSFEYNKESTTASN